MHRTRAALLVAALALPLTFVTAAHAAGGIDPGCQSVDKWPGIEECPISIPATKTDDSGNPVVLDAALDLPIGGAGCPCPVIIDNHGFLGSWHSEDYTSRSFAQNGYIVLRYSSRGFGLTPGQVDLVGPKEQQDFLDAVHYANGERAPMLVGKVIHNDVGQYGGSYGGGHAWYAATSGDPAIKAVVPAATWYDFYQALVPNDVMLAAYADGFYATGYDPTASVVNDASNGTPGAPDTTQNYSQELHQWMAEGNSGVNVDDMKAGLDSRSAKYRLDNVLDNKPAIFIVQGSNDGLFSENQALEAYQDLKTLDPTYPVRLYIGGIGHPPSEGSTSSAEALYLGKEMLAWFDHYLKGVDNGIDRQPPIEFSNTTYFHNQQPCPNAECTTRSAYAYPAGPAQSFYLCSTGPTGGDLSATPCATANPVIAINTPGLGGGYDQEPVTASAIHEGIQQLTGCGQGAPTCQNTDPDLSSYPAILKYDAPAVTDDTQWFGPPTLDLQAGAVDVLPAGMKGELAAFQLDPKFYDVDGNGNATLITRGAYAEPLNADSPSTSTLPSHEVKYDAFGLSYLLKAGHHLRLTLSTSDVPYLRPTPNPFAVALFAGSKVDMPSASYSFEWGPNAKIGDLGPGPGPSVPEAPWPALLAAAAVLGVTGVELIRRRRKESL